MAYLNRYIEREILKYLKQSKQFNVLWMAYKQKGLFPASVIPVKVTGKLYNKTIGRLLILKNSNNWCKIKTSAHARIN